MRPASATDDGCCITPAISADGRSIVIMSLASNLVAGDTNGTDDVFVVGPVLVSSHDGERLQCRRHAQRQRVSGLSRPVDGDDDHAVDHAQSARGWIGQRRR